MESLPPPRVIPPAPLPEPEVVKPKLPVIPPWNERDPDRAEVVAHHRSSVAHRLVLRQQLPALDKAARRALAELDCATLELGAVEARRKVADTHLEKARSGVLGIEYIPPLVDIVVGGG
ncbi:hypothetical protein C8R46DRAFT_1208476 [Mycena filopes]|nr:hypothetical protein C8R46DRAFT_1208476 [Mycena filopes]